MPRFVALVLLGWLAAPGRACTTLVAGRLATTDGSVMVAHSNDGDGLTAGNLKVVAAQDWALPAVRGPGSVAQVAHTYAYFTKVGGYASTNEHQVALAESTCVGVFAGNRSSAALNIVDLSELGLASLRTWLPLPNTRLIPSLTSNFSACACFFTCRSAPTARAPLCR